MIWISNQCVRCHMCGREPPAVAAVLLEISHTNLVHAQQVHQSVSGMRDQITQSMQHAARSTKKVGISHKCPRLPA